MRHSENVTELAKALAAAQAELDPAVKDSKNPHLNNKYADLASCWDALKGVLPKHGLSVSQAGGIGTPPVCTTLLMHVSGQWIEGDIPLLLGDARGLNAMQVYGSAWSYARRYGLTGICGLTAADDDAATAGKPVIHAPTQVNAQVIMPAAPAQKPAATAATPAPAPREGEDNVKFVEGTLTVEEPQNGTNKKTGKPWTRFGLTVNGTTYGTFDEKLHELGGMLDGQRVRLGYTEKGKYKTAATLESVGEVDTPADTQGDELPFDDKAESPF